MLAVTTGRGALVRLLAAGAAALALVGGAPAGAGAPPAAAAPAASCTGGTVAVVAHPDDDLFFLNPVLSSELAAGTCTTIVYATSGDAGRDSSYPRSREAGVRAAWSTATRSAGTWTTGTTTLAGTAVATASLSDRPLTMVYLRLPDGGLDAQGSSRYGWSSIPALLQGGRTTISTTGTPSAIYTADSLVATVAAVIRAQAPSAVRTQDFSHAGDVDHPDHHAVAKVAVLARDAAASQAPVVGYYGYPVNDLPANVTGAALAAKQDALYAYAPYDDQMCGSTSACSGKYEAGWLARQHVSGTSLPSAAPTPTASSDAARTATATASSQNAGTGQTAAKAVDGVVDGYPGDHTAEWATQRGGAGSTLTLTWASPVVLSSVVLFDRPNADDRVTSGTLAFSDGTTVAVGALDDAGAATPVTFSARSTTSLTFRVGSVSATTANAGLAELQAWTPAGTGIPTTTPTTTPTPAPAVDLARSATATASSQSSATGQTAAKAVDGVLGGYPGDHTAEWASAGGGAGATLSLAWSAPVTLGRVVLHDRPNTDDRITGAVLTFSDGSRVAVPALADDGSATTVAFAPRATTSLRLTTTSVSATTRNAGLSELLAYAS
ncbi:PIG-L family deacetylase [Streptomyces sp. NP160]|uniref:PIG-L family deacetylase n=1 Tax=Streptomyces sp. NP160 TaxID=2586637 RepID=UPI001119C072|nr:PIG-L family deacetylase [Streptomyces sp. NP160]TNM67474.1 PIG-L family deacetylase [Streptomyces sp. NP160]